MLRAKKLDHDTRNPDTTRQVSCELAREFFDGRKIRFLGIRLSDQCKNKLRQSPFEYFIIE